MLVRQGRRVAHYLHADCVALFVRWTTQSAELPAEEREAVEKHLSHLLDWLSAETTEQIVRNSDDLPVTVVADRTRKQGF
jgi:K+-sensing histidine kinase KdpD